MSLIPLNICVPVLIKRPRITGCPLFSMSIEDQVYCKCIVYKLYQRILVRFFFFAIYSCRRFKVILHMSDVRHCWLIDAYDILIMIHHLYLSCSCYPVIRWFVKGWHRKHGEKRWTICRRGQKEKGKNNQCNYFNVDQVWIGIKVKGRYLENISLIRSMSHHVQ